ncbi:reverse transcriptase domain, reverse transcriptase zinc-binding domain protein [Tanacetum coccineum]
MEKGSWVNEGWCWKWDWVRDIRGRVCKEYDDLLCVLQDVVVSNICRDKWRWALSEDSEFMVKRALKGRLPVRVELDRRGINLDSVLCPSCNNSMESCTHSLVTCDLAMSVWDKIFKWWKMGIVNAFSIGDFFHHTGTLTSPVLSLMCGKRFFGDRDTSFGKREML